MTRTIDVPDAIAEQPKAAGLAPGEVNRVATEGATSALVAAASQVFSEVESEEVVSIVREEIALLEAGEKGMPAWDPLESTCRHASLSIL